MRGGQRPHIQGDTPPGSLPHLLGHFPAGSRVTLSGRPVASPALRLGASGSPSPRPRHRRESSPGPAVLRPGPARAASPPPAPPAGAAPGPCRQPGTGSHPHPPAATGPAADPAGSAQGELHNPRAWVIEPLQVIDGNDYRSRPAQVAENRKESNAHRPLPGRAARRIGQQERDLQRPPLRRQPGEHPVQRPVQQIAERRERLSRLRFGRPARQNRVTVPTAKAAPALHTVVLPIPAAPSSTRPTGPPCTASRNAATAAISRSRPTTPATNTSPLHPVDLMIRTQADLARRAIGWPGSPVMRRGEAAHRRQRAGRTGQHAARRPGTGAGARHRDQNIRSRAAQGSPAHRSLRADRRAGVRLRSSGIGMRAGLAPIFDAFLAWLTWREFRNTPARPAQRAARDADEHQTGQVAPPGYGEDDDGGHRCG